MAKEEKSVKRSKNYRQRRVSFATGEKGSCVTKFNHPWSVIFDWTNLQLVISDSHNHRIKFLDRQMNTMRFIGSKGGKPGQFSLPTGISHQPITNNILVCDYFSHRVQMINQKGQVVTVVKPADRDGLLIGPQGISCTPDGNFFVATMDGYGVQKFDSCGRILYAFGNREHGDQGLSNPSDVAILDRRFAPSSVASSVILVADNTNCRLSLWSMNGNQHIRNTTFNSYPRGVCVDLNGIVYVSTYAGNVEVLDPRKEFSSLQTMGSNGSKVGQFFCPSGMCVDHKNTLVVADSANNRLQFFI